MNAKLLRYSAWIIGVSIVSVSLFFVLLYGHHFGYIKSILWLSAFFLSFLTSMLVVEPLKQLALSSYLAITSKRTHFEINDNSPHPCNRWTDYHQSFKNYTRTVPQSTEQAKLQDENAKTTEKYLIYYRELSSDLLVFSLYLITLLMVILGTRDFMAYHSHRYASMCATGSKYVQGPLKPIISDRDFFMFLGNVLIPTLHPNQTELKHTGWLSGQHVKLLGVPRLRQHRVQTFCDIHKTSPKTLSKTDCAKWFDASARDMKRYSSGWRPYTKLPYQDRFPRLVEPWEYHSTWDTQTLPLFGQEHLYSGGGYTIELGRTLVNSASVLRYIRRTKWIDRRTTVVFVEFTLYSADSNLFNVITIIAERTPFGNYQVSSNIQTVKLLITLENVSGAELCLFTAYIMFAAIFVLRVFLQCINRKFLNFIRHIWNVIDTIIVVLSIGMVVWFFKRDKYVQGLVATLENARNNTFVSFYYAAFFDQLLTWWSSVLVLMATMRIWKIFHFINVFRVISHTFSRAASTLFMLTLVTGVLLVVMSFCIYLINGPYTKTFSSLTKTVTSITVLAFGFADEHFNSHDLLHGGKWLGIVLHIGLIGLLNIYLLSMFITIVCYFFTEVRQTWIEDHRLPFSYWQFLREEFNTWRRSILTTSGNTIEQKEVTLLEKCTARMELIDFQLSLLNDTMDIIREAVKSKRLRKK